MRARRSSSGISFSRPWPSTSNPVEPVPEIVAMCGTRAGGHVDMGWHDASRHVTQNRPARLLLNHAPKAQEESHRLVNSDPVMVADTPVVTGGWDWRSV